MRFYLLYIVYVERSRKEDMMLGVPKQCLQNSNSSNEDSVVEESEQIIG